MIFDELRRIQESVGYLPPEQLREVSQRLNIPISETYAVVDFYPHFHRSAPPRADVRVCCDMACHLRGADALMRDLQRKFNSSDDKQIRIQPVSCLGQCDGAPAISVNDRSYRDVTVASAERIAAGVINGTVLPQGLPAVLKTPLASDPYPSSIHFEAVRKLAATGDFQGVISMLKDSGLSGLGGAGFPTGLKWDAVRKAAGPDKYVICNADESEPGTIKDRFILEHLPHLVIEGMIIAGLVTGARTGILYLRHEYPYQEEIVKHEIERCYADGILGDRVCGSELAFNLSVFVSPGGYICGEETALMEAIEGKRAEPRNKPPFPVTHGLWGKPTALNNVETFANVPQILMKGVEWFKAQGRNGSTGLKFVGVSGDVRNPGVFEIPMGTPVSEVIYGLAGGPPPGRTLKAFAPSGPSSGYLPISMADVPLDFKSLAAAGSMLGSGAIVVCAEGRCMLDMALNAVRFFRNESCGKCVPCRVGTQKLTDILMGWTLGQGTPADMELVEELAEAMKQASICGLGQFAHSPFSSVVRHFREEIDAHILQQRCPEGVCPMNGAMRA